MINRTKVKESTQIKPGDNGDVLVMKDNAPEWSTPSDADLAKASETDAKLAEKQDKLTAGDNIKIEDNVISADGEPTPIAIGTVTSGEVPMVSNSGTDTDVVLNFVLPKGDKGDKGDQGLQGPQGPVGAPFQVKKIYDSVEAMNADYSGSDVAIGEFVLIDTGDVQDPDNSKLYVKGPTQYDFVTDLSGAQGIQGPQGNPGTDAGFGNITATVDDTTGTPQVSVQADGPNTAKNISFSFTGLKGEKGEKGDPGQDGTQVNSIDPLVLDSFPPNAHGHSEAVAIGYNANANGDGDVAILGNARGDSNGPAVAIGDSASAARRGIALGLTAAAAPYAVAVGCFSSSTNQAIAIGYNTNATAISSVAVGEQVTSRALRGVAIGKSASVTAEESVALGSYSSATDEGTVSVGSGVATLTLSDDMTEEQQAAARAVADVATRRIVNVTDPQDTQDAATKNYVDTQLTPINAKLQYVPENTNQILSQIETNVEKAQSAADAKVASITAGTGISVDASNPTAPVVSTTGLATQASVDALTSTVNSKANQTDLEALETTVAGKADASALANYATKTELAAKADQTAVDSLTGTVNSKVSSVTAGEGISITGTATEPVISVSGGTTDTGWLEITGSSGSGLKYLTGPWTIPAGAKVKIRKFGKRVTAVGVVQATEDISSGAATSLLSIPESDPYFDAFNLPQVSQYDIAHNQQKSAATSVLLIRGMLTSFNVEQNLDTPKINVTLVPVVGVAGQTAQIGNGDTVNFQISWDTED